MEMLELATPARPHPHPPTKGDWDFEKTLAAVGQLAWHGERQEVRVGDQL